ncbi:MAG: phosphotransferase [Candidatus Dojkabacteria bacterium]|nr:phosphotransferase [Candidatus Dojkabacteria bacterium]MDQ7021856.1 phosphotransferase [Candidatus Dojkabacteria bacterium]
MDKSLKQKILNISGLEEKELLAEGMESLVFDNGNNTVTKVYLSNDLEYFRRLQNFYNDLVFPDNKIKLPQIINVEQKEGLIFVTEVKLIGKQLKFNELNNKEIEEVLNELLNGLTYLSEIKTDFLKVELILDNRDRALLKTPSNDFKKTLESSLEKAYKMNKNYLNDDIEIDTVYEKLTSNIESLEITKTSLIHGDYFIENVLFSSELKLTSILDFGVMTAFGDHIMDVALSYAFLDMFNELPKLKLKERYMEILKKNYSNSELSKMNFYIAFYSFISATYYMKDKSKKDGHYYWCINNINTE